MEIISALWNSMSRSQEPCKVVVCLRLGNRGWCSVTNPETRIHVAVIIQQPGKGVMAAGTRR